MINRFLEVCTPVATSIALTLWRRSKIIYGSHFVVDFQYTVLTIYYPFDYLFIHSRNEFFVHVCHPSVFFATVKTRLVHVILLPCVHISSPTVVTYRIVV